MTDIEQKRAALNQRQQLFADAIISGKTQRQAYLIAGYDAKNETAQDAAATQLISNIKVKDYIEACRQLNHDSAIATHRELAILYTRILRTPLSHVVDLKTGEIKEGIDPSLLECITEYKRNGSSITIKIDRMAAASRLCELMGYNKPQQVETTLKAEITKEDLKKAHDYIISELPGLD